VNKFIRVTDRQNQEDKISTPQESGANIPELDSKYGPIIEQAAAKYRLNPSLIAAVIKAESNGDARAVSTAGAKGLMQLIDTTAADMGVRDVFNPQENIEGGAKYLRKLLDRFGDIKTALAAYNAGPETVQRYGGIPPYPETIKYVRSVLERLTGETGVR
jgi:soluble lytic murein transglycosylase-like protein